MTPATNEQLRAHLDAHGKDGPPPGVGLFVVAWSVGRTTAYEVSILETFGRGRGAILGGEVVWSDWPHSGDRIIRHAPLPDPLALLTEAEAERAEADSAAMRAALDRVLVDRAGDVSPHDDDCGALEDTACDCRIAPLLAALSGTAGRDILADLERLRRVEAAARTYVAADIRMSGPDSSNADVHEAEVAFAALRAAMEKEPQP